MGKNTSEKYTDAAKASQSRLRPRSTVFADERMKMNTRSYRVRDEQHEIQMELEDDLDILESLEEEYEDD